MSEKTNFSSKAGLIAATIGSAVGLGNVWRFPNEVHSNGGAAFLIVYIACVLLLGVPVMLAEFSLGRGGRSDAVGVFKRLTPGKHWWIAGAIALTASYLINCFYMVVARWTGEYLLMTLDGTLYSDLGTDLEGAFTARLGEAIGTVWPPLIATVVIVFLNIGILLRGVQKGIEKMSNVLMPLLFALLVVLCGVTLSLPGASDGIAFFLNPDFSQVDGALVMNALGQAFFSLSLGMGILITYSSYFPKKDNLTVTAGAVAGGDFLVALLMGFIIFPAVMTFGLGKDGALESAALVFVTLPEVFAQMSGTVVWSAAFFLLLFIAALTSTISISEVSVLFFQDRFGFSRKKAVLTVLLPILVFGPLCSLSQTGVSWLQFFGMSLFDLLDTFTTNWLLPLASLLTCIYCGWVLPKSFMTGELTNGGRVARGIAPVIIALVKWVAPPAIAAIFIYSLFV